MLLFRSLPRSIAAEVFAEFDTPDREALLRDLTDEEIRQIIAGLKPDDRTAILEELLGQVTQRLLNLLSLEDLERARFLLGYPEGA